MTDVASITEIFSQTIYIQRGLGFNNPGVKSVCLIIYSPMAEAEELKDKRQRWTLIVAMSVGLVRTNS